ncbi:hypothetical protein J1614_003512 [Plenodomus biglobosus]|nr:hypothetical protein J1614_003512 [Plenodomus biglobosus]
MFPRQTKRTATGFGDLESLIVLDVSESEGVRGSDRKYVQLWCGGGDWKGNRVSRHAKTSQRYDQAHDYD